jgi:hypothetical protein
LDADYTTLITLDFLLGEKLEKLIPIGIDTPEWFRLQQFFVQLQMLGDSKIKATKTRDYVTSVWVDCPRYVLPASYKQMGLPSLLDDAIHQLESKHNISIRITCLAGFFGHKSIGSALWRPLVYISGRRIERASDVYRPVLSGGPLPITPSGEIPLRLTSPSRAALSQFAMQYSQLFSNLPITEVVKELNPIIRNWIAPYCNRVSDKLEEYLELSPTSDDPRIRFLSQLHLGRLSDTYHDSKFAEMISGLSAVFLRGFEEFDHYPVVYELIANVLGLDVRECHDSSLNLVVVPGQCIGFTAPALESGMGCQDVITVSIMEYKNRIPMRMLTPEAVERIEHSPLTLEAIKVAGSPIPRYRAAGIWVPHFIGSTMVGAHLDQDNPDALLE